MRLHANGSYRIWSLHSPPPHRPVPTPTHNRSKTRGTPVLPHLKTDRVRDTVLMPAHKTRYCHRLHQSGSWCCIREFRRKKDPRSIRMSGPADPVSLPASTTLDL